MALERAALQPLTLAVEHPANRLAAVPTAILGLVPTRLRRRLVTSGPVAQRNREKILLRDHALLEREALLRDHAPFELGFFRGLCRGLGTPPPRPLILGVPGFNRLRLTPLGLASSGLPTPDQPQAFGILAVALVPTPGRVSASAPLTQALPRSRPPTAATIWLMMMAAHGSYDSQRLARGGTR